jgi:PPOX class probable F420-dependent enzyme
MGILDPNDEAHRRADERLRSDVVVWLTTVGAGGQPQSTPVWFLWDGESFLIYSQPGARKVANIRGQPQVSLHLNSDPEADQAVIVEAGAHLADDEPPADRQPDYLEKYRDGIAGIDMTPESFAADYAQPIRAVPTRVRAW